uniref:NADH-ubiquinone oxidoreductase chain 6 n=1 Tax=Gymnopis multiplicata TaxID=449092 RepID=C9D8H0_GYMMU|nr:NADH dehydrogenase subunit 6 [Gymnopis multiplicata]ACS37103.1 NADH dehydrogenase subunit 6 [Gymnopis multiplicata]
MSYVIFVGVLGVLLGMVGVASNPSPYFAAFGLVVTAISGCLVIVGFGMTFLSLVLFLVYLGGMLVVFAYSAAMSAEPFPVAWGNLYVVYYVLIYSIVLLVMLNFVDFENVLSLVDNFSMVRCDWGGVANLYSFGGWILLVLGWVLLVTLFVVLEITRVVSFVAMLN